MQLELSDQEAELLAKELDHHLLEIQDELVHTDKHALQRSLVDDLNRLRVIRDRLSSTGAGVGR